MRESVTYQSIKDEGSQETTQKIAVKMLQEGLSPEMVAKVTGLTLDVVQQLQITEAENQRD
jgi:predicted transposase YdaD